MTKLTRPFFSASSPATVEQSKQNSDARFERRETAVAQRTSMANTRWWTIAGVIFLGSLVWLVLTW